MAVADDVVMTEDADVVADEYDAGHKKIPPRRSNSSMKRYCDAAVVNVDDVMAVVVGKTDEVDSLDCCCPSSLCCCCFLRMTKGIPSSSWDRDIRTSHPGLD